MNVFSEISEILNNPSGTSEFVQTATSKYKDIYVSLSDKILIQVWNTETAKLTNNEFEEEANLFLKQVILHHPTYVITDQRSYRYQLSDEQYNWYINNLVPKIISNGIKRFAIVINEDLRQQAKLEEIINDVEKYRREFLIPTRFFNSITEAIQWK